MKKKNLMAVLTASSVVAMAAGATLAAYAEPEQEQQFKDETETYSYGVDSKCLYINNPDGFVNWKADERIDHNEIEAISFDNFYDENGEGIPAGAFEGLTGIKTVKFNNRVSVIGENAFKGCTSLMNIDFDAVLSVIGESAFEDCVSISQLNFINTGVREIGKSAFKDCTGLMDIAFGYMLEEIGDSAFEGCTNLGKTESKPNEETNNCDIIIWLHEITFEYSSDSPNLKIGSRAFYGCENLTAFRSPYNVEIIGEYAFANCTSLYVADMRKCTKLKSIEKYAFFNCLSLTQVHFPKCYAYRSGEYYDYAIPKHTIAEGAFRNCPWLEGVILSPYVDYVAPGAFYNCKGLEYIGYYVNKTLGIGNNIEIKVDTEHSTQDPVNPPQNSGTVTVYVPPEVTAFSVRNMEQNEKTAAMNKKTDELFRKKLAESDIELKYEGQFFAYRPYTSYEFQEPQEPSIESGRYDSISEGTKWFTPNNESQYKAVYEVYKKDLQLWNDYNAYMSWYNFRWSEATQDVKDLWSEVLYSKEYNNFSNDIYRKEFCITLYNEPTSESPIVLPEKFKEDADIYSITRVNGDVDVVNIPIIGSVTNEYGVSFNYYDFSEMEARGYNFTANYLLGWSESRTYRSANDIDDPKASGLYGTVTGDTQVKNFPVNSSPTPDTPSSTTTSSGSSDTTTPGDSTPSDNPSNPSTPSTPTPPPTPNTNDPIEPDPEPSEPESSEPESSGPESSEPESSEPESSESVSLAPPTQSEQNPNTGARFLAPIVIVGAAVVVVAARRRKMK